ncbi:hypothetical protein PVK06_009234 [Gossypium arboreum]|uniref:Uncharacterized protein n=1 Tax=Gossypium arboreum TaxID=29729 RepID=A0ABR0QLV9_GOSAR|nr:hypothetical protein PVK06_009234 [Gossypium arboreum]
MCSILSSGLSSNVNKLSGIVRHWYKSTTSLCPGDICIDLAIAFAKTPSEKADDWDFFLSRLRKYCLRHVAVNYHEQLESKAQHVQVIIMDDGPASTTTPDLGFLGASRMTLPRLFR